MPDTQQERAKKKALLGLEMFLLNAPNVNDGVLLYAMIDLLKNNREIEFRWQSVELLNEAHKQVGPGGVPRC
jgi:hypothetical protein